MNIKSLLIGSAAALVAVTGARAADAVMAPEPEPVEYVRVCDAYGAGFFYIPGTETCLQISGYVWYQIAANSFDPIFTNSEALPNANNDLYGVDTLPGAGGTAGEGWYKSVRARVNFDARSETEWGTLKSYIRFQASWNGVGDGAVSADQAYISLGGLVMGYTESFWANSMNGGASNWGSHSWSGLYYGYQQRALIGYRFESNGFFGAISLEDDALAGEGYLPDVVAKIGYTGGWGTIWAKVAYDESFDGTGYAIYHGLDTFGINDGGFAASLGAQFNVPNMPGSNLRLIGYYADGAHAFNVGSPSNLAISAPPGPAVGPYSLFGGSEWSILASYNHQFSETLGASVGVQYFNDLYYAGSDVLSGADAWAAELSVVWFPVSQFEVRGELRYDDVGNIPSFAGSREFDPDGTVSGYLRFTRYF
ncbi:MAG: porin [Mesorhizobium sp.]|nr:porin [Mesorhizobium sp.]MCO5159799.1 porin [Mesorhizobium sp.]